MGTVTITFQGICTHFRKPATPLPVQHRVVLLNASSFTVINSLRIPPHHASLTIQSETVSATISLQGVTLKLDTAQTTVQYDTSYDKIVPSLGTEMNGVEELSPPDFTLIKDHSWPTIAAYFDVDSGTFSACNSQGSARATLTVETPDNVRLIATPFPNTDLQPLSGSIDLGRTAALTVQNISDNEMDDPMSRRHFALHYLLAQFPPTTPQIPTSINDSVLCPGPVSGLFNAGCSDTNYP